MTGPSKLFLENLKREVSNRRISEEGDLDGFKSDIDAYFDIDGLGKPFSRLDITYTHNDMCKIVAEYEVIDSRPWSEIKDEIVKIWNVDVSYTHSEFEFTEDSSGQTFHFFTFEDDFSLFVTGQIIFRRS